MDANEQVNAPEQGENAAVETPDRATEYNAGFDIEDEVEDKSVKADPRANEAARKNKKEASDDDGDDKDAEASDDLEKRAAEKGFIEKSEDTGKSSDDRPRGPDGKFVKAETPIVTPVEAENKADAPPRTFNFEGFELPDGELEVAGKTVNLKNFVSDVPEIMAVSKVVAEHIVKDVLSKSGFVTRDDIKAPINSLSERAFWSDVSEEMPGAKKIYVSKEFQDWLGKQAPGIKELAERSGDSRDMVDILERYNSSRKKSTARSAVMSGNLQSKPRESLSPKVARDEFMEGFNLPD